MSTTTWFGAEQVDVEQGQPLGAGRGGARPSSTTSVSQKMLAVSASAIGSLRLQRRALGELGVVVGVAELVRRRLGRVDAAGPVEEHERAVVDERHAERPAALAVARAGVDPLLVDGAVDEPAERRAVRAERVADDVEPVVPARSARRDGQRGDEVRTTAARRSWPCRRALARIQRRKSGSASSTAACIASNVARLTLLANSEASSGLVPAAAAVDDVGLALDRVHRRGARRRRPSARPRSSASYAALAHRRIGVGGQPADRRHRQASAVPSGNVTSAVSCDVTSACSRAQAAEPVVASSA